MLMNILALSPLFRRARLQMHELAGSVRGPVTYAYVLNKHYTVITNKIIRHTCFQYYPERLQKTSGTPRSELYASFISCRHLGKPSL